LRQQYFCENVTSGAELGQSPFNAREFFLLRKKKQTLIQMWGKTCFKWFLGDDLLPQKTGGNLRLIGF
jgi:hypothetical protein